MMDDFSTMWLYKNEAYVRPKGKKSLEKIEVPAGLYDDIKEFGNNKIAFKYKAFGEPCRVETVHSVNGVLFVIRKLMHEIKKMDGLGVRADLINKLMQPNLSGLVVFAGLQGVGKTTLASSLLVERINAFGGSAQVIEDPPELDLDGVYTKGIISQIDVHEINYADIRHNEELGYYASRALRADTDIVYIGEILRSSEAKEVVTHSGNGALIITTIHSGSVSLALERLINLAGDDSEKMLSNTITAVIYVSRKVYRDKPVLVLDPLFFEDAAARVALREKNFNVLENISKTQIAGSIMGK